MSRIKVNLPEILPVYTANYTISIADINYGNHLSNDKSLSIMHEARMQWLVSLGFKDELDFGEDGLIVTDAALEFKLEGFFADALQIDLYLDNPSKYGFDLYYKIKKEGKAMTLGKTGMLFLNYTTRKVASVPEIFKTKVGLW